MVSLECEFRDRGNLWETTDERSNLYYNQYGWAVSWHQPEISALRDGLDPNKINKILVNRRHWEKTRWDGSGVLGKIMKPTFVSRITAEVEQEIKSVADMLRNLKAEFKMVLNPDHICIYTTDRETAKQIADRACATRTLGTVLLRTVNVCLPADTVVLKRPYNYQYRTWFRSKSITKDQRDILANWIKNMGKEVYPCPSLKKWLRGTIPQWRQGDYSQSHYFVDHNDGKLDVWMAMVCPGIVRKTQAIQSPAK